MTRRDCLTKGAIGLASAPAIVVTVATPTGPLVVSTPLVGQTIYQRIILTDSGSLLNCVIRAPWTTQYVVEATEHASAWVKDCIMSIERAPWWVRIVRRTR